MSGTRFLAVVLRPVSGANIAATSSQLSRPDLGSVGSCTTKIQASHGTEQLCLQWSLDAAKHNVQMGTFLHKPARRNSQAQITYTNTESTLQTFLAAMFPSLLHQKQIWHL